MEKIDFIEQLLASASDEQKNKIIDLSMKELGSIDQLSLRLDGLEALLSQYGQSLTARKTQKNTIDSTEKASLYVPAEGYQVGTLDFFDEIKVKNIDGFLPHDPQSSNEFLSGFSRNDEFKFFTHVKEEFSFQDLMASTKKLNSRTYKLEKSNKLNSATRQKVLNFCSAGKTGTEFWVDFQGKKCECNWSSVKDWCKEHEGKYPTSAPIQKGENQFDDIIKRFKKTIEIRHNFKELISQALIRSKIAPPDLTVEFAGNEFEKVKLYIDVHLLFLAIKQIFEWIKEHKAQGNMINISIENDKQGKFWELRICHVNSELQMSPDHAKFTKPSGDLATVKEHLQHVADWKIETKVKGGKSHEIVILPEVDCTKIVSELETSVEGFTHVLRLYEDR